MGNQQASERRLVENEQLLRESNEEAKRLAEKAFDKAKQPDLKLHFHCECSDLGCQARVVLDTPTYQRIHERRDRFVLQPGHEIEAI
jgi:hypothetical protein